MKLIDEALKEHHFIKIDEVETTQFYIREEGKAIRFAILHRLDVLSNPIELNTRINELVPTLFINNPAFKKNCDLICIHKLDQLAEFKQCEEQIFAIEEDPHFFKKYILYYSDMEEKAIDNKSYKEMKDIISDKKQFNEYKDQPIIATQYSVAAKIFIKLPFLDLPFNKRDLVPLRLQAESAVHEVGLTEIYKNIQDLKKTNLDFIIKGMINDELENI